MNNKNLYIIGGVVAVLAIIIVGYLMIGGAKTEVKNDPTKNVLPESEVVPTVDSSVEVAVKGLNGNKEVVLSVKNVPAGTVDIDFELSYLAQKTLPKGAMGKLTVTGTTATKTITLGTCSSGSCVYDQGVENVEVSLMFNFESGAKTYKKEFPL